MGQRQRKRLPKKVIPIDLSLAGPPLAFEECLVPKRGAFRMPLRNARDPHLSCVVLDVAGYCVFCLVREKLEHSNSVQQFVTL